MQNSECGTSDGTITLSWTAVNEPATVIWDNQAEGPSLENLAPGTYCATFTGANGCQVVSCYEVEEIPLEAPAVIWNDTTLSAPAGFATYQWFLDAVLIEGAVNPEFTPLQSGSYTLGVTNSGGCEAFSDAVFVVIQSVRESEPAPYWKISPNPFRESLHIWVDSARAQEGVFEVFSGDGRLMWKGNFATQTIDASAWPAGTYRLRLTTPKGQWSQTCIKG